MMLENVKKALRDERGQGMTEYILIVVLIAIAAIVAFTYFRDRLNSKTTSSADTVFSAE
jgi:pilus assembly protein Flp/PilA